jgi:hypothetical protein
MDFVEQLKMKKTIFTIIAVALAAVSFSCSLFNISSKSDVLQFSPDTLPAGQVGRAYKTVITLSNQRTPAFNMGADEDRIPPGLTGTFDQEKQTYTLEGTPTQAGAFSLTISALCYGTNVSGQTGEKEYRLVIKP